MPELLFLFLVPFVLGLAARLALGARLPDGATRWTNVVGMVIAGILFIVAQVFASGVVDDFWGFSNRGLYTFLIGVSLVLWFLGVGLGALVRPRRRRPPESAP